MALFTLIGGVFTVYKFVIMVLDRREKVLREAIKTKASSKDLEMLEQAQKNMKNIFDEKMAELAAAQTAFVKRTTDNVVNLHEKTDALTATLSAEAKAQTEHMHQIDIKLAMMTP